MKFWPDVFDMIFRVFGTSIQNQLLPIHKMCLDLFHQTEKFENFLILIIPLF